MLFFVFCWLYYAHVPYGFLCLYACFILCYCKPLQHDLNVYSYTAADFCYYFLPAIDC